MDNPTENLRLRNDLARAIQRIRELEAENRALHAELRLRDQGASLDGMMGRLWR